MPASASIPCLCMVFVESLLRPPMLPPCIIVRVGDKQPVSIMACMLAEHVHNALVMIMLRACVDCPTLIHVAAVLNLRATSAWFRRIASSHERAAHVAANGAIFKANT